MNRTLSRWCLPCLAGLAMGADGAGLSDEGPAGETDAAMPVMMVTATRAERPILEVPYAGTLLDADTLRLERSARTVPEALKGLPGVMVQKTGHGQGSPYLRGFTSQRTLFLIDGIRLNNSVFREGPNQYWNTVDVLGLERIEMARGALSVLYGSDAIGGTVQALTRGKHTLRAGRSWDRRLYYRYASAENAHATRAESIGRLTEDLTLSIGYSLKNYGDLEGGRKVGRQPKTGYDERDWDAKLEYSPNEDVDLVLAHQSVEVDDAWRTHKTIYGIDWKGLTVGKELRRVLDQERALTYLKIRRRNAGGFAREVEAGISRHFQEETRDRLRTGDRHDKQGFEVTTLGAFLAFRAPTSLGDFAYGAEVYHDRVDSFHHTLNPDGTVADRKVQGPVGDNATYDTLGLYLRDEISVSDRLDLHLGGRYEFAKARAKSVEHPVTGARTSLSDDWRDGVGSARLSYFPGKDRTWALFAGVSQGFRAPNLSDLTRLDSARTDEIETPSFGLDPERFVSWEMGTKVERDGLYLQLACFHTDIDGMIVRTPTGRLLDGYHEVTKKNGGDGYVRGIELEAQKRVWREVAVFGVVTWLEGKIETYPTSEAVLVEEPPDRLMPLTGRFGLRWDLGAGRWIESACTFAAKADKLSTRDRADTSRIPEGGTPGYTVVDLRAGWEFTEALALSVAIENLADEDYRVHGSGVNEPGRNFVVSAEWTF